MNLSASFALRVMVVWLLGPCLCYAGSHPTRVDQNSACLECHADLATGDHVHPAVKLGCASCHSIENREDASYVVLKQAEALDLLECATTGAFPSPPFPNASGKCLRWPNPHLSANPRLLRAKV